MITDIYGNKWYKGNTHLHTLASDGRKSLDEAAEIYRNAGYDFICVTDHWKYGKTSSDGKFTVLNGCEYHTFTRQMTHIVSISPEREPELARDADPQEIVDAINDCGGAAILAHPAWSLNTPDFIAGLEGIVGTEIYNSVSGYPYSARPYSGLLIDEAIRIKKKPIMLLASDDTHYYEKELFRGFIYLKAEENSPEALLCALKKGDFIASGGPFAYIETGKNPDGADIAVLKVCGGADHAQFFSANYHNRDTTTHMPDEWEKGKSASFVIKPTDGFVRAEVCADGKFAYPILRKNFF